MSTVRIQFECEEERVLEMDALIAECGFSTRKELFNNALTLFKWAVRKSRDDCDVAAVDVTNDKLFELQMPFLMHVRDAARKRKGESAAVAPFAPAAVGLEPDQGAPVGS